MSDAPHSRYEDLADEPVADVTTTERATTTLDRLAEHFGERILARTTRLGEATVSVKPDALSEVMHWLRDEETFALLSDLTAHDCHGDEPRFWVIYQLTSVVRREQLRVKVGLPEKKPSVESMVAIWPGANFFEREVYDLFGIEFRNHPNLTRIMMPAEWEGHPLRKDFPIVYEPVMFTHNAAEIRARKPFAER